MSTKLVHEVKAVTEWRCPDVAYVTQDKVERSHVEVNDIVILNKEAYQVHEILSATSLIVSTHDPALLKSDGRSKKRYTFNCATGINVNAVPRAGTIKICSAVHANAFVTACVACGSTCEELGLHEFVRGMLLPPLQRIRWKRVVLDESHKLQCTSTAQFRCISKLKTRLKWCMTGTPMPKCADNLNGQFSFLGIPSTKLTQSTIPWIAGSMIRHTKKMCLRDAAGLTSLPAITYTNVHVALTDTDMLSYSRARSETRACYAAQTDGDATFYTRIFQCLSRERRACTVTAPKVKGRASSERAVAAGLPPIPADALNAEDDCPVCMEAIPHPVVLPCRHCFCHLCLLTMLENGDHYCSLCKEPLDGKSVLQARRTCRAIEVALAAAPAPAPAPEPEPEPEPVIPAERGAVETATLESQATCLPKFQALLDVVQRGRPTLVYTQFDDAVHTLKLLLEQEGIAVQILTGSSTRASREQAIARFRASSAGVLILSLRTAAVGLNLIHASQVVFMEPAMNTGLEAQACGRVYRLGQRNPVEIIHLIAVGTVDEKIRLFRDIDTSDTDGSAIQIGKICVVMSDRQRKLWRTQRLQNLIL